MVKVSFCPPNRITCPQLQPDKLFNQSNPTSGLKYEVLATTPWVRLISIGAYVLWTAQPTPLEIYVTVDGQAGKFSVVDPVSNTGYYPALDAKMAFPMGSLSLTDHCLERAYLLDGRSVKVEAEITGGTVSRMVCVVRWAKWP